LNWGRGFVLLLAFGSLLLIVNHKRNAVYRQDYSSTEQMEVECYGQQLILKTFSSLIMQHFINLPVRLEIFPFTGGTNLGSCFCGFSDFGYDW